MRVVRFFIVCSLFFCAFAADGAFGQACPPHSHVTSTTLSGRVRTIHCGCDEKYVNVDGRCSLRTACVSDAGYQLIFALRDCAAKKPSVVSFACLKGTGITIKSLRCLQGFVGGRKNKIVAFAKCGLLGTVPIDAAVRCQDINDACITSALQAHKAGVARCRH
jgi:hypothetical protein